MLESMVTQLWLLLHIWAALTEVSGCGGCAIWGDKYIRWVQV